MHMRTKKWSRPELGACSYYIKEPEKVRGQWLSLFPSQQPLHIELVCGKGVSTAQMVFANRDINYIAVDINADVMGCTRRNIEKAFDGDEVKNVMLTNYHVGFIDHIFSPEDVTERIYISFCNPWNERPRQRKRRLTHPRMLLQYRTFLKDEGEIWFKTDDKQLFADSLRYFEACGFEAVYVTRDLHGNGFQPNYISEHERKFLDAGMTINFGIFRKKPGEVCIDPDSCDVSLPTVSDTVHDSEEG